MSSNKFLTLIAAILLIIPSIQAQTATTATGGKATGSNGIVNYSVGQIAYASQIGTNGHTLSEGVQLQYELFVVTGVAEANDISLKVMANPNPVTDYLQLNVEGQFKGSLSFQLCDISGKVIDIQRISGLEIQIDMHDLKPSSYFIRIINNEKVLKVFKIIKK